MKICNNIRRSRCGLNPRRKIELLTKERESEKKKKTVKTNETIECIQLTTMEHTCKYMNI